MNQVTLLADIDVHIEEEYKPIAVFFVNKKIGRTWCELFNEGQPIKSDDVLAALHETEHDKAIYRALKDWELEHGLDYGEYDPDCPKQTYDDDKDEWICTGCELLVNGECTDDQSD